MNDPMLDLIAQLPQASMAPDRTRRTQARCHRILARRAPSRTAGRPARWRTWSPALIGLGTLYLTEAVRQALRVYWMR